MDKKGCFYCGNIHETKCPLISAYEYDDKMNVKRIEFVTFVDFMGVPANALDVIPPGTTKQ